VARGRGSLVGQSNRLKNDFHFQMIRFKSNW
jgi:hypothetical protein